MPYTESWNFELLLGFEPLQVVGVLDPFLDKAAFGADEAGHPHIEAGQVDRDPAPTVKHRGTALATEGGGAAFRTSFIVFHGSHLIEVGYSKKKIKLQENKYSVDGRRWTVEGGRKQQCNDILIFRFWISIP